LRNETEWVETIDAGWNLLVGSNEEKILEAVQSFQPPPARPVLYGDGCAAARCVDLLAREASSASLPEGLTAIPA
jgi:UDP-GlcNAc3NAcA epimerase